MEQYKPPQQTKYKEVNKMADLVNREDIFTETIRYLKSELERHITDEMTAKGKVQEAQELLNRLQQTCYLCGRHVPNYRSVDLAAHIEQEHADVTLAEEERVRIVD